MQVKLVVLKGGTKVRDIKLRLPTIVGRGRNCSLQLPHPLVSRQHCEIFEADGKLIVRDLASLNGTFLNDQKITECEAPTGAKLTIGVVSFRIEYEASTAHGEALGPENAAQVNAAAEITTPANPVPVSVPPAGPVPVGPMAGMPTPMSPPMSPMPAAPMATYVPGSSAAPAGAPLAVPLAAPLASPLAAPAALPPSHAGAAPLARPLSAGPSANVPAGMMPPTAPAARAADMPPRVDFIDFSETTQTAEENRAAMEAANRGMSEDGPPEEFAADEFGEDHVEVVDDAASLLPPLAIAPAPTLPNVSMINPAAAMLPPSSVPAPPSAPVPGSAPNAPSASSPKPPSPNPAERPATADSEQDLLVFLKSLGK